MPTSLSPRQLECARLFARGLQAKEIGRHLNIRETTVESHLAQAYQRLGVSGRASLRRILVTQYGDDPVRMPDLAELPAGQSVGGVDPAPETASGKRTLYELYKALGLWRTPPRPPGGRWTVVVVLTVISCMFLGTLLLALSAVYAVLDSAGFWN